MKMLLTNPAAVLLDVTDNSRQYTKRQRRQPAAAAPAPTRNKAKRERQSATADTVPHPAWKEQRKSRTTKVRLCNTLYQSL